MLFKTCVMRTCVDTDQCVHMHTDIFKSIVVVLCPNVWCVLCVLSLTLCLCVLCGWCVTLLCCCVLNWNNACSLNWGRCNAVWIGMFNYMYIYIYIECWMGVHHLHGAPSHHNAEMCCWCSMYLARMIKTWWCAMPHCDVTNTSINTYIVNTIHACIACIVVLVMSAVNCVLCIS